MHREKSKIIPIFEEIARYIPAPVCDPEKTLQILVTSISGDDFKGRIAIGRIHNGTIKANQEIMHINHNNEQKKYKLVSLMTFSGLKRIDADEVSAGDIVALAGIPDVKIGETITDPQNPIALPIIDVEQPTVKMTFMLNDSPFAGKEGQFSASRQIRERLFKELETDVALKVEDADNRQWVVSGRGELHLSILIERMRREGYEVQVSQPKVILKSVHGEQMEPVEQAIISVPDHLAGTVIEKLGKRRSEMLEMNSKNGTTTLIYNVPTRGLLGFRAEFIMDTKGEGILHHSFARYERHKGTIAKRINGVLISGNNGKTASYALENLQERSKLFIGPGIEVYEGMIIGENARRQDMTVNPCKEKKQTNIRAAGADDAIKLTPPIKLSLEQALEFIDDDELVEITPKNIRLRKKYLTENERSRLSSSN